MLNFMQLCKISTTVLYKKKSFHLRTTDHVIQGATHRAAAGATAGLERTPPQAFPPTSSGAVKWPALSSQGGMQAPSMSDLPRVRSSLRLTRRWVHISWLSCFVLSRCTSCGPWQKAEWVCLLLRAADRIGKTHFSIPHPDAHECKEQAIKTTFPPLRNCRSSPSQISKFICLTCSLFPSETTSLTTP